MNQTTRTPSKAVAAGTAAGLRHLERVYVAKVNSALAEDRDDLANELAHDHNHEVTKAARAARAAKAEADKPCRPNQSPTTRRPRWFTR